MKFEITSEIIAKSVDKYIESIMESTGVSTEHIEISQKERDDITSALGQALIPVIEFCEKETAVVEADTPRQEAEREIRQFWPSEDHESVFINCSDDSVWLARKSEGYKWTELPILPGSIRETVLKIEAAKAVKATKAAGGTK